MLVKVHFIWFLKRNGNKWKGTKRVQYNFHQFLEVQKVPISWINENYQVLKLSTTKPPSKSVDWCAYEYC